MIFYYANMNIISSYVKEINDFRNILKFLKIPQFFKPFDIPFIKIKAAY